MRVMPCHRTHHPEMAKERVTLKLLASNSKVEYHYNVTGSGGLQSGPPTKAKVLPKSKNLSLDSK